MDPIARIVDANANRASEGLRFLENVARFALDSDELSGQLKRARHALFMATSRAGFDAGRRLDARDTDGDVGIARSTQAAGTEPARADLADLIGANAARVAEALRTIEECFKLATSHAGRSAAGDVERIRYDSYTIEKRLVLALGRRGAPQWRLCVLLTESLCDGRSPDEVAGLAMEGGADCIQLREKTLEGRELTRRALSLVAMANAGAAAGRPRPAIIINDRPDVAMLAGADGVHLGQGDLAAADVRRLVGSRFLIGVSTSNIDEARAAAGIADYCGVGPMFPTTTKHKDTIVGPAFLAEYLAEPRTAAIPHLAIGGITPPRLAELVRAGVRGIAVSSAVCSHPDPKAACRELLSILPTATDA